MTDAQYIAEIAEKTKHGQHVAVDRDRLNAIAKRLEDDEWRPIETAPKDGTRIKLFSLFLGLRHAKNLANGMGAYVAANLHIGVVTENDCMVLCTIENTIQVTGNHSQRGHYDNAMDKRAAYAGWGVLGSIIYRTD